MILCLLKFNICNESFITTFFRERDFYNNLMELSILILRIKKIFVFYDDFYILYFYILTYVYFECVNKLILKNILKKTLLTVSSPNNIAIPSFNQR